MTTWQIIFAVIAYLWVAYGCGATMYAQNAQDHDAADFVVATFFGLVWPFIALFQIGIMTGRRHW